MKHTQLSQFQKEQYTAYLETQLEKFSAFMLGQKKENERYKLLEELISHHTGLLEQVQAKVKMLDFYQNQIVQNQENLFKKSEQQQDFEIRLRRLQDRDRYDCDREARKHYHQQVKERRGYEQISGKQKLGEPAYNELSKRLKMVEEKISKQSNSAKSNIAENAEILQLFEDTTNSKIKKVEKKMKKYFTSKFEDIQQLIKKTKKHKSKSPAARTPIEFSIASRQPEQTPLTQFKLEDHSTFKSDYSTVLRSSKNTTASNINKVSSEVGKQKQGKKRKRDSDKSRSKSKRKDKDQSKSKSKSKSKRNDQSRSLSKSKRKGYSRSVSRSKILDKSYELSDRSNLYSSTSNLSRSEVISKKKNQVKKKNSKRSVSRSRSDHSSISLHEKCKKRPEFAGLTLYNDKSKEKVVVAKKKSKLKN